MLSVGALAAAPQPGSSGVSGTTPAPVAQEAVVVPYKVSLKKTGNGAVDSAVAASSQLQVLQKTQAVGPYALSGRIRADYDRVNTALESQGYYAGHVTISVDVAGQSLDGLNPELPDALKTAGAKNGGKGSVKITIAAALGTQFRLGDVSIVAPEPKVKADPSAPTSASTQPPTPAPTQASAQTQHKAGASPAATKAQATTQPPQPVTLTEGEQKAFGLASGQPALAATVLAAQGNLLTYLEEEGYATAVVATPVAYLKPQSQTLDIIYHVERGPKVVIGPIALSGLVHVKDSFLRRRLTLHEGELYRPSTIEAARQDLAGTGVFSTVQVHDAPPIITLGPNISRVPGVTQAMPVNFGFAEGKRHTLSAQAGFSTDLGGRAGVSWTHHNLLGAAEQLKLTALVTGLGGSAQQGLGYDVYADFNKPDFLRRDQTLSLRVEAIKQLLYSYRQTAFLARGGLGRHLGRYWFVSAGLMGMREEIQQFGDTRRYFIISTPLSATYDSTQLLNPIDPATHGIRASLTATPSVSLGSTTSFFTILTAQASTYFDFARLGITKPGSSVLAVRGIVGSVQGASTYQIPPDQRLYAGGPATVRGFRYQGVGPQYGNTKYAIGGTSMDAGTVEFRQRLPKNLGMAAFVDAGQVGTGSRPGQGTLRIGYGAGVRYFTPIGPVRVDVALPVNRPAQGDKWELYLGLGETF
ncbi:outer membrane protein [Neokomagataea thailandica NBRC 106555]|uniref:Outer membrane protein n=1 Tax=Neokomagataea thailandica NBRC 106555 TaxID=1223520 RepID=A0ABQ0QQ73_9PROT|nr:outer membrane protein [Neokomagataea thailandica NBRC 106555]